MTVDRTKLQFYSGDPIDKVVSPLLLQTHTNGANSYSGYTGYPTPVLDEVTIPNPYGKKCFVRYKWSVDGANYNQPSTNLLYSYTTTYSGSYSSTNYSVGCKAAVAIWASDSQIGFQFYNDYHSNQSVFVSSDFTQATSQTGYTLNFTVKYVLFEIL